MKYKTVISASEPFPKQDSVIIQLDTVRGVEEQYVTLAVIIDANSLRVTHKYIVFATNARLKCTTSKS